MFDAKGLVCRWIGLSAEGKYFPYKSSLNKRKEGQGRHRAHIWISYIFTFDIYDLVTLRCIPYNTMSRQTYSDSRGHVLSFYQAFSCSLVYS